jgi:DNA-binding transcriptional ArsR family regulator
MRSAEDPLSLVFHALADPTRRAIIERLAQGPARVGDLADPFAISRPAISQHLRVLEEAGLITRTVEAQWRLCSLTPEPLEAATDWVERNRRVWSDRFDILDDVLRTMRGDP